MNTPADLERRAARLAVDHGGAFRLINGDDGGGWYEEALIAGHVDDATAAAAWDALCSYYDADGCLVDNGGEDYDFVPLAMGPWSHRWAAWIVPVEDEGVEDEDACLTLADGPGPGHFPVTWAERQEAIDRRREISRRRDEAVADALARFPGAEVEEASYQTVMLRVPGLTFRYDYDTRTVYAARRDHDAWRAYEDEHGPFFDASELGR